MMTTKTQHYAPGVDAAGEASDFDRLLAQERIRLETHRNALEPNDYAAAMAFAKVIVESGMFPDKDGRAPTIGAILLRIMTGRQLGISSTIAFQHVYDLYGRVGISAALKRSLVRRHPECERYEMVSCSDIACEWVVKRKGSTEKTVRFSLDDAKRAQIVKKDSNWEKWPRRMLQARASSEAADLEFADAVMGLTSTEELYDDLAREPMAPPVGAAVASGPPARDWAKETAEVSAKVCELVAKGEPKAARDLYNLFAQEAPEAWCEAIKAAYNRALGDAKSKAVLSKGEQKGAPAGAQQALTTPATADPYLPPNQRGDAYAGPLEKP
jgi:hypothetical protein